MGPYFEASVLRMEVSESDFCLQLQFEYHASGPLVQQDSPTKQVLEIVQSWDVVFSSDRWGDRFTGKPVSPTTGLYYDYQRWYDPSIGRFISQDSDPGYRSDPQSLNPYLYVENTPTTYTDPTGECPWCIAALIGAGIGAAVGYGWCVAETEGWTSSACGEAALGGAVVGGLAGLTFGLSLYAAPEEEAATAELVNTADFWANTESTTTTITTDTTTSISAGTTPVITSTSSEGSTPVGATTFSDDQFVVRGGLNTPESLQANLEKGGISANSYPGMSVEQLSKGIPNNQIGVTTVGDIRAIGGDVVSSPNEVNPFHATIIPGPGGTQELSGVFDIRPNPWRLPR